MKFMDALAKALAVRVHKNLAAPCVQRKCDAADLGMLQRLAATDPDDRSFCPGCRPDRIRRGVRPKQGTLFESILVQRGQPGRGQMKDRTCAAVGPKPRPAPEIQSQP